MRATLSAVMERRNARTAGRSAFAQSCATVDGWLTEKILERNANGLDDFAQGGFRRFRFSLERSVARAGDDAMREDRDGKLFEIVRQAEIAAVQECPSLRRALQH